MNKSLIYDPIKMLAKVSVNEIIGALSKRTLAYVVSRLLFYAPSEFHLTGYKFGRSYCTIATFFIERNKRFSRLAMRTISIFWPWF